VQVQSQLSEQVSIAKYSDSGSYKKQRRKKVLHNDRKTLSEI